MTEQKERNFEEKDCKARSISLTHDAKPSLAINRDVNQTFNTKPSESRVIPLTDDKHVSILAHQSEMTSFVDM